ncbi:MAG: phosphoglucosamine mutase, partial [Oscillospiraceae bacterium]|nr:phosphoglucosamine mutase [Oscillospiraceae bacterium]
MSRLFTPNGIRNIAVTNLTCELVWQIGRAVTAVLDLHTGDRPEILIAKDTRISSDILESSLCAGICSAGGNAVRL